MKLIYLSIPYTHLYRITMEQRVLYADFLAAEFLKMGVNVLSPITQSHRLVPYLGNEKKYSSWDFWKEIDLDFIDRCDCMVVCRIKGWKKSIGVSAEIEYCKKENVPTFYLDFGDEENVVDFEKMENIVNRIKEL
jgi:hypothetical protein